MVCGRDTSTDHIDGECGENRGSCVCGLSTAIKVYGELRSAAWSATSIFGGSPFA